MEERGVFSGRLFALAQFFLFFALVFKPSPYRKLLFLPITIIDVYLVLCTTTGNTAGDGMVGALTIAHIFYASDYILLTEVQHELRRIGQVEPISKSSLWHRIRWGFQLFFGPRGIGWTHEPTYALRSRPTFTSRSAFMISQTLWIAVYMILYDAASLYNRFLPAYFHGGASFVDHDWLWRSLNLFGFTIGIVTFLSMAYCIVSVLSVASWTSEPRDWPHLFGYWTECHTLRRFWGKTWHQYLRRLLLSHSDFITYKVLRLRPQAKSSLYVRLYVAFLTSGIIHAGGGFMMMRRWHGRSLWFYLAQAVAITVENGVIVLATKLGCGTPRLTHKILGSIWVWCWFVYSMDSFITHGQILDPNEAYFSVILWMWRGDGLTTFRY